MPPSPDYIPAPQSPDSILSSAWVRLLGSLFVGFVFASIFQKQKYATPEFWLTLVGSSIFASLVLFYVRHQYFMPHQHAEVVESDKGMLTDSITSSRRSAHAISSNWLDLWRSPTFRYYLHLDAVMSLIAYSSHLASPLAKLSDDQKDRNAFFEEGWTLVGAVGEGEYPSERHRFRLLIYPEWVYDKAHADVLQLIKSHSAARIPCIPLVAETLYGALNDQERIALERLVTHLGQDGRDKMPPVSRVTSWRDNRALKKDKTPTGWPPVFPDMLLIDSQFTTLPTSVAWWYSRDGHVRHWDSSRDEHEIANEVFSAICRHAKDARWSEYSPGTVGSVALTADTTGLGSEAFFAQPYYREWLGWIKQKRRANASARGLNDWLEEENRRVGAFVTDYEQNERPLADRELKILDIGCGFGRHLVDLAREHGNLEGVGVDINAGMVAEANRAALQKGIDSRCTFIPGDVSELADFKSEEFDLAICMTNTLGNLPIRKQAPLLQRLREILKPDGQVLISVYAPASVSARMESYKAIDLYVEEKDRRIVAVEGLESEAFEPRHLERLLRDNGFKAVGEVEPVTSIGWQVVATRDR